MIFQKTLHYYLLPLGILIAIPGCKQISYTPKSFKSISKNGLSLHEKNRVTLEYKLLSKPEVNQLFDGRGNRLLRKRKTIYSIYVTLDNKSDTTFILDPKNISIPLTNPSIISYRLHSHTHRRIFGTLLIGATGAGISFFAAVYITIVGAITVMPQLVKAGYAALGLTGFFTLGTPYLSYKLGSNSARINTYIDQDITSKSLSKPIALLPGQATHVLLFVHRKVFKPSFFITLIDQKTENSLIFEVNLKKESQ